MIEENHKLQRILRRETQRQRLGDNASCAHCGEKDPVCLTKKGETIVCYECQKADAGKATVEKHHVAGQHNLPDTVPIPANDHRVLSDMQYEWPTETLRNPDESPLLRASATIRGWLDVLRLIIERTVGWIPDFLERLDDWLREKLGQSYWTLDGFPSVRGGMA